MIRVDRKKEWERQGQSRRWRKKKKAIPYIKRNDHRAEGQTKKTEKGRDQRKWDWQVRCREMENDL